MKSKTKSLRTRLTVTVILVMFLLTYVAAAETNQKLLDRVREFLINKVDEAIQYLEYMKSIIDSINDLDKEQKNEIKTRLDESINLFEGKKSEINTAKTRLELLSIIQDMRHEWKEITSYKECIRGIILTSRFDDIITKAEHLSDRIDVKITELDGNKADTVKLRELHSEFDAEISVLKEKVSDAKKEFKSGNRTEGYLLLMEAKKSMDDGHNTLRDIVKEYRKLT